MRARAPISCSARSRRTRLGGTNFALQALPVIIFFASLVSILYHLGIMQRIVRWVGGAIEWVVGISKVESLCAAANIFVGQSESPLVIRPYLAAFRPSQLFQVMMSGMAGVAGTILAAYASMGIRIEYLLAASFMSAPGAILMAKMMMPDDPAERRICRSTRWSIPAAATRTRSPPTSSWPRPRARRLGVRLAVMVGAMVFAFVGLVALANGILGGIGGWFGIADLTFQRILGYVFAPIMYLISVPWDQARRRRRAVRREDRAQRIRRLYPLRQDRRRR